MKKIPFHWIKITGSIYSFTFSSLLWNFECVASILKIHWQGKNPFYTSFAVTYHSCDTYNIYTNQPLVQWKNQLFDILLFSCYSAQRCMQTKPRIGPFSPLTSPPETTAFHPVIAFQDTIPDFKIMISTPLLRCKIKNFFPLFFFQRSAERYLFDKITENTYYLVLNVYFEGFLLTKSCICFTISQLHTMPSLSTSNPSNL